MRKQSFLAIFILSCLIGVFSIRLHAQTTISGPSCVIPGLAIQYLINGNWTGTSSMEVCIKNGKLESGNNCYNGKPVSFIRVIWDNSGTNGSITLNSSSGNASQSIRITRSLKSGIIDVPSERQVIKYNNVPPSISCSPALWGGCDPVYSYQWEQSSNRLEWKEVIGSTGRNLSFSTPLKQTTFFRRKVLESNSRTIGYTNTVAVFVIPKKN